MRKLNIGEMLIPNKDMPCTALVTNTEEIIKKGTKQFVKAGSFPCVITFSGKEISLSPEHFEVTNGFAVNGIAEWIYRYLRCDFDIDEMLEAADWDEEGLEKQIEKFKRCIANAL